MSGGFRHAGEATGSTGGGAGDEQPLEAGRRESLAEAGIAAGARAARGGGLG